MEHIVAIIDSLAWPITILIGLFVLRKSLIELLPQLKKLKYKELEMEFEKGLDELSIKSQESKKRIEVTEKNQEEEETDYYLEQVKEASPRAAILESWLGLEATAISTVQYFDLVPKGKRIMFGTALKTLEQAEVLTKQDVANINDLRALRNKAVHEVDFPISEKEAAKFMEIARDQSELIAGEAWQKFGGCSG